VDDGREGPGWRPGMMNSRPTSGGIAKRASRVAGLHRPVNNASFRSNECPVNLALAPILRAR